MKQAETEAETDHWYIEVWVEDEGDFSLYTDANHSGSTWWGSSIYTTMRRPLMGWALSLVHQLNSKRLLARLYGWPLRRLAVYFKDAGSLPSVEGRKEEEISNHEFLLTYDCGRWTAVVTLLFSLGALDWLIYNELQSWIFLIKGRAAGHAASHRNSAPVNWPNVGSFDSPFVKNQIFQTTFCKDIWEHSFFTSKWEKALILKSPA